MALSSGNIANSAEGSTRGAENNTGMEQGLIEVMCAEAVQETGPRGNA
ncbi:MAG: hypothetical protein OEV47_15105 [Gammaproteobacteria bacterium]|nr:hypothetical protein [Gammaproteobacteria bacterium]